MAMGCYDNDGDEGKGGGKPQNPFMRVAAKAPKSTRGMVKANKGGSKAVSQMQSAAKMGSRR